MGEDYVGHGPRPARGQPAPYRAQTLDLSAARLESDPLIITFEGNVFALTYLTGTAAQVNVRFDNRSNDTVRFLSPLEIKQPFRQVLLHWAAVVAGEADIFLGTEDQK